MDPIPAPLALIATKPGPCQICEKPTRRFRSLTHLQGPPKDVKDLVRICMSHDEAWTAAVSRYLPQ